MLKDKMYLLGQFVKLELKSLKLQELLECSNILDYRDRKLLDLVFQCNSNRLYKANNR